MGWGLGGSSVPKRRKTVWLWGMSKEYEVLGHGSGIGSRTCVPAWPTPRRPSRRPALLMNKVQGTPFPAQPSLPPSWPCLIPQDAAPAGHPVGCHPSQALLLVRPQLAPVAEGGNFGGGESARGVEWRMACIADGMSMQVTRCSHAIQ